MEDFTFEFRSELTGKSVKLSPKDVTELYKHHDDYYVKIKGSTYALCEGEHWSLDTLLDVLSHEWNALAEEETDCGDCDGWDYSNCDYSRCRNRCEGCGGRIHICNRSCFNKRHKASLHVRRSQKWYEELNSLSLALDEMMAPHSQYRSIWDHVCERVSDFIEFGISETSDFMKKYRAFEKLMKMRTSSEPTFTILLLDSDGQREYRIHRSKLSFRYKVRGILFWKKHYIRLSFGGYDAVSDTILKMRNIDLEPGGDLELLRDAGPDFNKTVVLKRGADKLWTVKLV